MMDAFTSNNTKIIIQEEKEEEMKTSASASASAAVSEEEKEDRDDDENDDDLGKEEEKYCRRHQEEDDGDDEDSSDEAYETYAYRIEMVSNFFFFSASIFYLIQSIWDMQYANHIIGIPKDVLLLGDNTTEAAAAGYDDDYVFGDDTIFTTPQNGYDVGLYTIIYFCGAVCFVFCGIADCCNPYETSCLAGFFFIVAGLFDLAASIFVDSSPELSNILDLVSSNLYLFEAIQLFCTFESGLNRNVLIWTCIAYIMFGGGACMDVIMGFVDTFANVNYSHSFAVLEVFDSVAWVGSAIILSVLTVYRRYYEDDDDDDDDGFSSSSLSFDMPKMIKEISPSTDDISSVEEDSDV